MFDKIIVTEILFLAVSTLLGVWSLEDGNWPKWLRETVFYTFFLTLFAMFITAIAAIWIFL
jgi:hypothetical protein